MKIVANDLQIEVEDSGAGDDGAARPAVLLIMGLGMQLVAWPPELVQGLVDAGYRVIRRDNRDVGLSQRMESLGKPNLLWAGLQHKLGFAPRPPYTVADMAADALGVLDALGVQQAHVVGMSMGGMIAQRLALAAPNRVLSLTSVMSSSGARGLPQARPEVMAALMRRPSGRDRQAVVDHYVRLFRVIGSPGFETPEPELRQRIALSAERGFYPVGTLRQMLAVMADSSRAAQLAQISAPTLVFHGKDDPLLPYACGEDTARRIPGARLIGVPGMGHDLPLPVVERLLAALLPHMNPA
jgi:pimeloyl-ACP methyl ester carboxylesterase